MNRRSYSLSPALVSHGPTHLSTDAFSASRMRTSLGLSRTSKSLHRTMPTSDIPLSLKGTPESVSVPPDALPVSRSSRMVLRRLTLQSEDSTSFRR